VPESPEKQKPNVVNLAEARRRQRTVRAGASQGKDGAPPKAQGWRRLLVLAQLLVFLAAVAYMMTLCRGGG
jgi:hypothetical protein